MSKSQGVQRKNYHHGDLKRALLEETARILREEGEEALSLRSLATNLGVSRMAPYNHFKNKDTLLCAVAEEGFKLYSQAMASIRKRNRNRDGLAITRAMVKAYVDFARNNQEYYDLMYGSNTWRPGKLTSSLATLGRATMQGEIERLRRYQELGLIKAKLDVVQFAHVYWGSLHGITRLLLDGVYTNNSKLLLDGVYINNASVKRLCDSTADMLWQQLTPD